MNIYYIILYYIEFVTVTIIIIYSFSFVSVETTKTSVLLEECE